jgi:hypothetical protein
MTNSSRPPSGLRVDGRVQDRISSLFVDFDLARRDEVTLGAHFSHGEFLTSARIVAVDILGGSPDLSRQTVEQCLADHLRKALLL